MDKKVRARLGWIELFQQTNDAGYVCRRCGISRPTLRKWLRRCEKGGIDGLKEKSRRPLSSPNARVTEEMMGQIISLRKKRKLGCKRIVNEMPFSIQRMQTDRGKEFFAYKVQEWLGEYCTKFHPIKPRSPHLNGKIERSHKTDLQEFYTTQRLDDPELEMRLFEWQHFYNWYRPHSSLGGKTPTEKCHELSQKTPFWDEVEQNYEITNEPIREQNFYLDQTLRKLK